jgi:thiol-disulfide isomerase/thioredoxin
VRRDDFQVTTDSGSIEIVMYSRPGCHLCDSAADVIRSVQKRYGFEFRVVNVEEEPELESRYGTSIPVVQIKGKTVFRYRVDKGDLEREVERLWNR